MFRIRLRIILMPILDMELLHNNLKLVLLSSYIELSSHFGQNAVSFQLATAFVLIFDRYRSISREINVDAFIAIHFIFIIIP